MLEIPSKVKDKNKKYIRMPNRKKVVESDDEWDRCGKWILINSSGSMSWIDETWIRLQVLLEKGCLIMIKASTAAMAHDPNDSGVILCFTRPGEEEIERAAKEIREIVQYESCMYYKINKMTENGIDHRFEHERISNYMHTLKGFFYRRCVLGWELVNENGAESENQQDKSFSRELWNAKNFVDKDFNHLVSRSSDVYIQSKDQRLSTCLCFTVECSLEEVENCLSEADRLWIIGKKLIDEGVVARITCAKSPNTAKFRILFRNKLDKESIVKLCNKIQDEAQVFRFIYIVTENICYWYSPEKELGSLPYNYKEHKALTSRKKMRDFYSDYVIED